MRFEELVKAKTGHLYVRRSDVAEIWNAALEAAAIKVLLRGDKIGGAVDPDLTAKAIRSLKEES